MNDQEREFDFFFKLYMLAQNTLTGTGEHNIIYCILDRHVGVLIKSTKIFTLVIRSICNDKHSLYLPTAQYNTVIKALTFDYEIRFKVH